MGPHPAVAEVRLGVRRSLAGLAPGAGTLAVWAIVAMPISLMALIVSAVQIGLGRRHIFNLAQVASPAVTLVLTLVFVVVSHLTPGRLVAAFIIGAIVSLIAGAWGLPWGTAALELRTFRQDLKFGLRLHAADLLVLTSLRLDVLVMSALFPAVQIGLYGAANSALMPVLILTSGSSALLTAKVANMAASRDPDVPVLHLQAAAVLREARKYALVSLAGGVALAALSPVLVRVVLGSAYGPAVKLIWILMPGYVCLGFSAIVAAGAEGMRNTLDQLTTIIPAQRVRACHCNDTTVTLGGKADRHVNIGKGNIGLEGFRTLLNYEPLAHCAFVLETPGEEMLEGRENLDALRSLL